MENCTEYMNSNDIQIDIDGRTGHYRFANQEWAMLPAWIVLDDCPLHLVGWEDSWAVYTGSDFRLLILW